MSFTAAIDISTFVWCQEDYDLNTHNYYKLINLAPAMFDQIKANRIPVLLRTELLELLMAEFPYTSINHINPDYEWRTLSFLTDSNWFPYNNGDTTDLSTDPNLSKDYFTANLKMESSFQLAHLHDIKTPVHKYITYQFFYNHDKNLIIAKKKQTAEIDTLRFQSEQEISDFFYKHKIKFAHNPKHNKYKAGGKISPLSCFNERDSDITKAQNLLDSAFPIGDEYYNYDTENNAYVVFADTNNGTYHGYDLSDEGNNVPIEIKNRFNKNGRQF